MRNMKIAGLLVAALLPMAALAAAGTTAKPETPKAEMAEHATANSDAAMRKEAKISMKQAQAIAIKAAPGKVKSGELERENGNLIYSFDIRTAKHTITEVNVNAMDGKVLDTQVENAAKEAAEKVQEAAEKK